MQQLGLGCLDTLLHTGALRLEWSENENRDFFCQQKYRPLVRCVYIQKTYTRIYTKPFKQKVHIVACAEIV